MSDIRKYTSYSDKFTVPIDAIKDWRVATMKCVFELHLQPNPTYCAKLAKGLSACGIPNMTADGQVRVARICEQAVKLQMMMRAMKYSFTCEGVIEGRVDSVNDLVEEVGVK